MTGLEFIVWVMAFAILGLCVTTSLFIVLSARYKVSATAKDLQIADLIKDQENNLRAVIAWQTKYIEMSDKYNEEHRKYEDLKTEAAKHSETFLNNLFKGGNQC